MSCETLDGKEDPLLGLKEEWKEWLSPLPATGDKVDIKSELEQEEEIVATNRAINIENKQDQESVGISSVKEEESGQNIKPTTKSCSEDSHQYKTIALKSYKSYFAKEGSLIDISSIFTENVLLHEKNRYHQQIFNEITVNGANKMRIEELQTQYIEFMRKNVYLETFDCSKCSYQTMHKLNMQTHLFLIHKMEMEYKIYKCNAKCCYYKTSNLKYLEKHLLTHNDLDMSTENDPKKDQARKKSSITDNKTEDDSFICDFCSFKGEDKESTKTHLETHKCPENSNRYLCYVCDYGVIDKTALQRHLLKVHAIITKGVHKFKEQKCDYCEYSTDSKECYNIHMMQHKNPDEIVWLKCTDCEFKTKHKASLRYHMKNPKVPEEHMRRFMCEICSKKFKTTSSFKIHLARHKTTSEVFKCPKCKFQSKLKTGLREHMKIHRDPTHVCSICGHRTRRKANYEHHMLTHKSETEVEVFKCSICSYSTKFKAYLRRHLVKGTHWGNTREHTTSNGAKRTTIKKRHICVICGTALSSITALNTHSVLHKNPDEVEMFKCQECSYESKFKPNLIAHQKIHKPPEFKCEICGQQSKSKWNHNTHLLTHKSSSECELFSCSVCSYQTKIKPYLREHLKKRHNILTARRPGGNFGLRKTKDAV